MASEFNATTQSIFANKAGNVLSNSQSYTIYDVEYVGYLNENILSLVIKSTLKEGNNLKELLCKHITMISQQVKVNIEWSFRGKRNKWKEVNKR